MRKLCFLIIIFSFFINISFASNISYDGEMEKSLSDKYQGNYEIKTGVGLKAPSSLFGINDKSGNQLTGKELESYKRDVLFFGLYDNVVLPINNPTFKNRELKIDGASSYPYFLSDSPTTNQDGSIITTYNFLNFPKWETLMNVIRNPRDPNSLKNDKYSINREYQDYNIYYSEENSKLTTYNLKLEKLELSESENLPTEIFARLNQKRGNIILSLYNSINLNEGMSFPMVDFRQKGLDENTKLNFKTWFSSISTTYPENQLGNEKEVQKIKFINQYFENFNNENDGEGPSVKKFNKIFNDVLSQIGDSITSQTEGAVEYSGIRSIDYTNDIDNYGDLYHDVDFKFRIITVGGEARFKNWFHEDNPYQLSKQHFIKIRITRPVIKFENGEFISNDKLTFENTDKNIFLNENKKIFNNIIISEKEQAKTSNGKNILIDRNRILISLIKKSDFDSRNEKNNDLKTVDGFKFLSLDKFEENINSMDNLPIGEYILKYDYSSTDSKKSIFENYDLGEIFSKPIYKNIEINSSVPEKSIITLKYLDENGLEIHSSDSYTGTIGESYNFEIKNISGYKFLKAEGEKEGLYGNDDKNLIFIYKKNDNEKVIGLPPSIPIVKDDSRVKIDLYNKKEESKEKFKKEIFLKEKDSYFLPVFDFKEILYNDNSNDNDETIIKLPLKLPKTGASIDYTLFLDYMKKFLFFINIKL